ncbi:MAG: peptidylprolyl isomerase [Firmicutes bacterium]|nr:peptidylprolyl isomerase [Bacillota bacterium]
MSLVFMLGACGNKNDTETTSSESTEETAGESTGENETSENSSAETGDVQGGIGMHNIEIKIKDYGTVKLELDGDTAPITVANFIKLTNEGFYNGLTFHRIMDGFMVQGGDPQGNGFGGSDETIKGEFASNGVTNNISHKKGVISMARAQDPNSASSQFFITVADSEFLDGNYAAFGHVTEGQDILDKIASDAKPVDNNGTIPKDAQPVIEEILVVE